MCQFFSFEILELSELVSTLYSIGHKEPTPHPNVQTAWMDTETEAKVWSVYAARFLTGHFLLCLLQLQNMYA